jgi:hypothetical protein
MNDATLHLKKKPAPIEAGDSFLVAPAVRPAVPSPVDKGDSQIDVELRLHGKRFFFRFDIPDAQGCVSATDIDHHRMLARVMSALDGRFGKLRLRAEL